MACVIFMKYAVYEICSMKPPYNPLWHFSYLDSQADGTIVLNKVCERMIGEKVMTGRMGRLLLGLQLLAAVALAAGCGQATGKDGIEAGGERQEAGASGHTAGDEASGSDGAHGGVESGDNGAGGAASVSSGTQGSGSAGDASGSSGDGGSGAADGGGPAGGSEGSGQGGGVGSGAVDGSGGNNSAAGKGSGDTDASGSGGKKTGSDGASTGKGSGAQSGQGGQGGVSGSTGSNGAAKGNESGKPADGGKPTGGGGVGSGSNKGGSGAKGGASGGTSGAENEKKQSVAVSIIGNADSGTILAETEVALEKDDTAFDVLKRVVRANKIQMEYRGSGVFLYVEGIDNVYEFDDGPTSGWKYRVNGDYPSDSAGTFKLAPGDRLEWIYASEDTGTKESKD